MSSLAKAAAYAALLNDGYRQAQGIYNDVKPVVNAISSGIKRFRGSRSYSAPRSRLYKSSVPLRHRRFRKRRTVRRRRKTYRRRFSRKYRKAAKAAPPIPRRTVYTKRFKRMRRYNKGYLNLQRRIQAGSSLPEISFARFYFRMSQSIGFRTVNRNYNGSSPVVDDPSFRTVCLNDVSGSPIGTNAITNLSTDPALQGQIMYKNLWQSLYHSYQILGAKLRIKIKPVVYPGQLAGPNLSDSTSISGNTQVPLNAQPGYYYARVYYIRAGAFVSAPESVGHPINPTFGMTVGNPDLWHEEYWPHERDFLADSSVTWKKDTSSMRTKMHWHTNTAVTTSTQNHSTLPTTGTSYELECSNRPVTLTVKFSKKKHFMVKDALRNGYWNDFDTQLSEDERFYVRFGYIGFSNNGTLAYHIPIDRVCDRVVDMDISYFAALRNPLVQPTMYNIPEEEEAMAKIEPELMMADDEEDDDDEFTDEEELTKDILPTNNE